MRALHNGGCVNILGTSREPTPRHPDCETNILTMNQFRPIAETFMCTYRKCRIICAFMCQPERLFLLYNVRFTE